MADKAAVGVRYCGGCNPRHDRVALVARLEGFFPEAGFVTAQGGTPYPAVVVACGCPSRCARVDDLAVPAHRLVYLSGWDDLLPARDRLGEALRQREVRALSLDEVLRVLPHREPMLFIDEVSRLIPGAEVTASFYVRPDLPAFAGHFPGNPVLPGVCTVEAAAQAADILLLTLDRYAGKTPLFLGIRSANFRRKILPGDTMELHAVLAGERPELGVAACRVQVFVRDVLCADVEVRLAMR